MSKFALKQKDHKYLFLTNDKIQRVLIIDYSQPNYPQMRVDKEVARVLWKWLVRGGYRHDLEQCSCDRCMDAMAAAGEREVERQQEMWAEGRR